MSRGKRELVSPEERRRRVYRERDRNLEAMGFDSYAEYLASDLWRGIRDAVLREEPSCFVCGVPATQVHHLAYRKKDLEGRDLRRLVAVCAPCHRRSEFRDRDGEKLNPAQANAKMRAMATLKREAPGAPGGRTIKADLPRAELDRILPPPVRNADGHAGGWNAWGKRR